MAAAPTTIWLPKLPKLPEPQEMPDLPPADSFEPEGLQREASEVVDLTEFQSRREHERDASDSYASADKWVSLKDFDVQPEPDRYEGRESNEPSAEDVDWESLVRQPKKSRRRRRKEADQWEPPPAELEFRDREPRSRDAERSLEPEPRERREAEPRYREQDEPELRYRRREEPEPGYSEPEYEVREPRRREPEPRHREPEYEVREPRRREPEPRHREPEYEVREPRHREPEPRHVSRELEVVEPRRPRRNRAPGAGHIVPSQSFPRCDAGGGRPGLRARRRRGPPGPTVVPEHAGNGLGNIFIGTASWTDKTLISSGFYPKEANDAESRLRFYADNFPIVEVDSTYYFPPSDRNVLAWVNRTPESFTFHIKAYSLLTKHPTRPNSLPKDLAEVAKPELKGKFLYSTHLPETVMDEVWRRFAASLMPLHSSGKLGVVHFQFPEWFLPGTESRNYLIECQDRLPDYRIAVEFRNSLWLEESQRREDPEVPGEQQHPAHERGHAPGVPLEPPPLAAATAKDIAYVRFHGRNVEQWDKPQEIATPRFAYLYSQEELEGWVPKIQELSGRVEEVHVLMNNCYRDYACRPRGWPRPPSLAPSLSASRI